MGVSGFFTWLMNRYPSICRSAGSGLVPLFDCFFIDFNSIIHSAVRQSEGSKNPKQEEIISEALRFTDTLVQAIKPTKLLFLAVDGPVPLAKTIEQRRRRFTGKGFKEVSKGFSKNAISVGTEFMENLHQELNDFIQYKIENDYVWGKPKVIYSSYHTPGEGEHKIFDFIRAQRKCNTWDESFVNCVYSPDADLFFICLSSHIKYFCIMKDSDNTTSVSKSSVEQQKNNAGLRFSANDFSLIYLNLLQELMCLDFLDGDQTYLTKFIEDFCAISFLLGNDFLPSFPNINTQSNHFNICLYTYKNNFLSKKQFLVDDGIINYHNLGLFFEDISIAINEASGHASEKDRIYELQYTSFIKNAGIGSLSKDEKKESLKVHCQTILNGFSWVLNYYMKGCSDWNWYYPNTFSPGLLLVSQFCDGFEPSFSVTTTYPTPIERLLCVLPASNVNLIPTCLQYLTNEESPIYHLFQGNSRSFEKEDYYKVQEIVKEHQNEFTQEEKIRNTLSLPLFYNKGKSKVELDIENPFILACEATNASSNFKPGIPSYLSLPLKLSIVDEHDIITDKQLNLEAVLDPDSQIPPIDTLKGMIGKVILTDYPFLTPSRVTNIFPINSINSEVLKMCSQRCGISLLKLPQNTPIVEFNILKYLDLKHTAVGFSQTKLYYPYIFTAPLESYPTLNCVYEIPERRPQKNDICFIAEGPNSPNVCRLVDESNPKAFKVQIIHKNFSTRLGAILRNDINQWIPLSDVARQISIPENVIEIGLGPILTTKIQKSIGLRCIKKKKAAEGYVKVFRKSISVTSCLIPIIDQYFKVIGPLKQMMIDNPSSYLKDYEAFCEEMGDEAENYLQNISKWVKENSPGYHAKMSSIFVRTLNIETIHEIEKEIDSSYKPDQVYPNIINVDRRNLIWPGKDTKPYLGSEPNVGHHVIYVGLNGLIPFGTTGSVLKSLCDGQVYQIIADQPIKHGSTLMDLFKEQRVFHAYADEILPFIYPIYQNTNYRNKTHKF